MRDTSGANNQGNDDMVSVVTSDIPREVQVATKELAGHKFELAEVGKHGEKELRLLGCSGAGDSALSPVPTRTVSKDKGKRSARSNFLCCVLL